MCQWLFKIFSRVFPVIIRRDRARRIKLPVPIVSWQQNGLQRRGGRFGFTYDQDDDLPVCEPGTKVVNTVKSLPGQVEV